MEKVRRAAGAAAAEGGVLLRGAAKSLYGTAVTGLVGLSLRQFAAIPGTGGYGAVWQFLGAGGALTAAVAAMYLFGGRRRSGRFAAGGR